MHRVNLADPERRIESLAHLAARARLAEQRLARCLAAAVGYGAEREVPPDVVVERWRRVVDDPVGEVV